MEVYSSQGQNPRMDWESKDLPNAFKSFKSHAEFMFGGPLQTKTEEVKCNYLMIWAGEKGRQIFSTWNLQDDDKKKLESYYTGFESYCKPRSNQIYARYKLRCREQEDSEKFEHFVTSLKLLLNDCGYDAAIHDEMIRDSIVFGVKSSKIREKLINEGSDLTLQKCLDIARTYELSQEQLKVIDNQASIHYVKSKRSAKRQPRGRAEQRPTTTRPIQRVLPGPAATKTCTNCGRNHSKKDTCPARGQQCNYCLKFDHFATVCRSKLRDSKRNVHEVINSALNGSDLDLSPGENLFIDSIDFDKSKNQAFAKIHLGPKSKTISMKIDSGSQVNILPRSTFQSLGIKCPLQKTPKRLTAYDGGNLKVDGYIRLDCTYNNKTISEEFYVVETNSTPILGLNACVSLELIKLILAVDSDTPHTCPLTKEIVLDKYSDVFDGIGHLPGECEIYLKSDSVPVVHPPRRVPIAIRDKLKAELERMEREHVIKKVTKPTDWVNSLVTVEKPNGSIRICLDPKDLNDAIKRPHYPNKTLDDILPDLTDAKIFSRFDARSGYWSIVLTEKSSFLTTFQTPFGRYRFLRLPFGLKMAQDEFISKMDQCLEGLPGVKTIVDDIVVYGSDRKTHDRNVDKLMSRCRQMGIKLNADKTDIGQTQIPFYGHVLTSSGLKMDSNKVKALREMPPPTSKAELETVLGMITYLQKFAPNMAELTKPMRQLLRKDVDFVWEQAQQNAFDKIKDVITKEPVLAYFDYNKPITIQTDASKYGLGCVLLQDGKPVCFASKSLTPTEVNYAQITKELYAVVFACKHWNMLVLGKRITVQTDHRPLVSILKKGLHSSPPRLQRMLLQLSKYDIDIQYVRGRDIPVADTLSRKFLSDTYPELTEGLDDHVHAVMSNLPISDRKMDMLRTATATDVQMQKLKQTVLDGWPDTRSDCHKLLLDFWNYRDEITFIDGILLKGTKVIIPKECRKEMLEKIHASHLGIEKCTQQAREVLFWPSMTTDIRTTVLDCAICLEHRNANQKEPLYSYKIPDRPWQTVATDLFHWNNVDYVVLVDLYSRYFEVSSLRDTRAQTVINKLKSYFSRHGISETLISDNGPQFSCTLFADFCKEWDIRHTPSSPHYPQANPAERTIQTIKNLFNKALTDKKDPYLAILAYRNTPIDCGKSPAQLLFSRQLRSTLPVTAKQLDPSVPSKSALRKKMQTSQTKSKHYYDRSAKPMKPLNPGEGVRIRQGKLWKPAIVRKKTNDRSYIVETQDGGSYRRNRRHLLKSNEKPFQLTDPPDFTPSFVNNAPKPQIIETRPPETIQNNSKQTPKSPVKIRPQSEQIISKSPQKIVERPEKETPVVRTRSGRVVHPPRKLDL